MPIDPGMIPALEEELRWAHQTLPGGQGPDPARIAAIEEQIAVYRAAETQGAVAESPAPENLSEQTENYETTDDADERREQDVAKKKSSKVKEEAAVAPEPEPLETADAAQPMENTQA
jgi:hypothetical protein